MSSSAKESTASCIIRFTFFEISSREVFLQSDTLPKISRNCVMAVRVTAIIENMRMIFPYKSGSF